MLAKCANPECSTPFRRLSEGKLFLVESDSGRGEEAGFDVRRGKRPRRVEYFWLCSQCAHILTLTFNAGSGVATAPLSASQEAMVATGRKPVSAQRAAGMLARAAAYHHD